MNYRTWLVSSACALLVGDMLTMLSGGAGWYPWVPISLVVVSAGFMLVPVSRTAGLVAAALWVALATIGIDHQKYFGPLGFAALSALVVAIVIPFAPAFAHWSIVPIAFLESGWLASGARQATFELATVRHVTSIVDACGQYFLPVIFAVYVVVVGMVAIVLSVVTSSAAVDDTCGRTANHAEFRWDEWRVFLAIALAGGAAAGFGVWRDWQINRPCM